MGLRNIIKNDLNVIFEEIHRKQNEQEDSIKAIFRQTKVETETLNRLLFYVKKQKEFIFYFPLGSRGIHKIRN